MAASPDHDSHCHASLRTQPPSRRAFCAEARAWEQLQREAADGDAGTRGDGAGARAGQGASAEEAEGAGEAEGERGGEVAFEELLMLMKERFLSGEDGPYFDYHAVDSDDRYDDGEGARDAEDRYFEDEDEDDGGWGDDEELDDADGGFVGTKRGRGA